MKKLPCMRRPKVKFATETTPCWLTDCQDIGADILARGLGDALAGKIPNAEEGHRLALAFAHWLRDRPETSDGERGHIDAFLNAQCGAGCGVLLQARHPIYR